MRGEPLCLRLFVPLYKLTLISPSSLYPNNLEGGSKMIHTFPVKGTYKEYRLKV